MPGAPTIADADINQVAACGLDEQRAEVILNVAGAVTAGRLRLEPGADVEHTMESLAALGVHDREITTIVMRALHWPDAFPGPEHLRERAASWRPWRAYAALHLELATKN